MDLSSTAGVVLVFGAFVVLVAAFFMVAKLAKKMFTAVIMFFLNSLTGLVLLFVIVYGLGFDVPLNFYTLLASMLFGVAGVATLVLLSLGGVI